MPVLRPSYLETLGSIVFPLFAIYWPFLTSESQPGFHVQCHNFSILGVSPQNFQKSVWNIGDTSCQILQQLVKSRWRKPWPNNYYCYSHFTAL